MSDAIVPVIEFRDVRKYYGDREVLRDVNLALRPGEIVGIIGPNGVGKTTLARILMGKVLPDGGQVLWHGEPMKRSYLKRIGYLPEERDLQRKMAVRSQLEFTAQINGAPWDTATEQVRAVMERVGVLDFADVTLENLSLGEQQRVQLAAALGHHPEALILDEPDSGLDVEASALLVAVMREQANAGVGVLATSHHTPFLQSVCDRVLILTDQSIAAEVPVGVMRDAGIRRFRVSVAGLRPHWAAGVPGAREVEDTVDGVSVVELDSRADQQQLVNTALGYGPLREFAEIHDILDDVYQGLVSGHRLGLRTSVEDLPVAATAEAHHAAPVEPVEWPSLVAEPVAPPIEAVVVAPPEPVAPSYAPSEVYEQEPVPGDVLADDVSPVWVTHDDVVVESPTDSHAYYDAMEVAGRPADDRPRSVPPAIPPAIRPAAVHPAPLAPEPIADVPDDVQDPAVISEIPAFEYSTQGTDWPQTPKTLATQHDWAPPPVVPAAAYSAPVTAPALAVPPSGDEFGVVQAPVPDTGPIRRSAWAPVAPDGETDDQEHDDESHRRWWSRRR